MRILIIFLFAVFTFNGFGQISFYKLYSGNGYDKGEGVVQLADSSYTITGSSSSWSGNSDAFLLHLDAAVIVNIATYGSNSQFAIFT